MGMGACPSKLARVSGKAHTSQNIAHYPEVLRQVKVTECDSCQRTNHSIKAPHLPLQPIPITGLWNLWGVDLIGPLTLTPRGNRYIIVATDYFSKWPEAAPLQNKEATTVAHFMYSLYCQFGASDIITDQGREFINEVKGNIIKAQNSQIATDLKRKGKIDIKSHVSVGDNVLVRNRRQESRMGGKLTRKYLGPFTVKTISDKGQSRVSDKIHFRSAAQEVICSSASTSVTGNAADCALGVVKESISLYGPIEVVSYPDPHLRKHYQYYVYFYHGDSKWALLGFQHKKPSTSDRISLYMESKSAEDAVVTTIGTATSVECLVSTENQGNCRSFILSNVFSAHVTGVKVLAINTTSVRVSWLAVQLPPDGILTGYTVYYLSLPNTSKRQSGGYTNHTFPPTTTSGDINNLNPNGVYQFSVVAQVTIMGQLYSGEMDTSLVNTPTITPGKVPLVTILQTNDM
eukprot:Em0011g1039a